VTKIRDGVKCARRLSISGLASRRDSSRLFRADDEPWRSDSLGQVTQDDSSAVIRTGDERDLRQCDCVVPNVVAYSIRDHWSAIR
jgi:hypothetical protein